jgi:hypothetical protein
MKGTIKQLVGNKKAALIETALIYWALHCHPTQKDMDLLDELAFEDRLRDLDLFLKSIRPVPENRDGMTP